MVVDGFGAAKLVDTDDQRPEVPEGTDGFQVEQRQNQAHQGQQGHGDFQVGIGHHGIAILFEVQSLGIMEARVLGHGINLSRIAMEDPPAVPLKM